MSELLDRLPDGYYRGVGIIVTWFMPIIVAYMRALWKKEERLEYDLAQIAEMVGTTKGKDLAPKLRKKRGIKSES